MRGEDIQGTSLVGRVLEDNVALLVLVLAQRHEDDVAVVDPDLFPQLSADQAETLDAVEALYIGGLAGVIPLSYSGGSGLRVRDRCCVPWPRVSRYPTSSGPGHTLARPP